VTVECHVGQGLPSTTIVGMPEGAVRESRDRVKSALKNSGYEYPDGNVVINLAPGGISKSSSALDLPIAISLLIATGQLQSQLIESLEFLGELGLYGELRGITGALACALATNQVQRSLVVPAANLAEAQLAPPGAMLVATHLREVIDALRLNRMDACSPAKFEAAPCTRRNPEVDVASSPAVGGGTPAFAQVLGQRAAKRALTIAAAGGHHLLMVGPPGTGKTLLARGFTELLPPLSQQQRLEVAALYSAAGITRQDYSTVPFRDPHHSASAPALVGGGNPPAPGEIALAHHGVLFLDELPHFKPSALDLLREPIESGRAVITRAKYKVTFPCQFQLIAAMNPCPAGRTCSAEACRCTPTQVQRYQSRISGPMLDRIDIQVRVASLPKAVLAKLEQQGVQTQGSWTRATVAKARQIQSARQQVLNVKLNGDALYQHRAEANIDQSFLERAITRYNLSARSFHKLWRIARTIADIEGARHISLEHMTEALSYRALDWEAGVM
jgi:magnesium chelatase family protein